MKRVLLIAIACGFTLGLMLPHSAHARSDKALLNWGVVAGYSITNATGEWTLADGFSRSWDTGFTAGLSGAVNISNHLALHTELLACRKGFIWKGDEQELARELNPFGYYIEIPVFVEWDFMPYNYTRLHLFGGPNFSYLIESGMSVDPRPKDVRGGTREIANLTEFNSGFIIGVRTSFPAGRERGFLELRYSMDLTNFIDETNVDYVDINTDKIKMGGPGSPDARHWVVTIAMGFQFD